MSRPTPNKPGAPEAASTGADARPAFEEPRLTFIEPKLTACGDLRDVTTGFISSFNPSVLNPRFAEQPIAVYR
jgi:hypothetical protein